MKKQTSKILLIDDDRDDQEIFCDVIREIDSSIECLTAKDGEEGLKVLTTHRNSLPGYIFLDLNMPRMNGKQCLKEIKGNKQFSTIPVIIYTTSSNKRDIDETAEAGAVYFLTKPTSISLLKQELENVLARY